MEKKNVKEVRLAEIRSFLDDENKDMIVEGYAVVFDSPATHGFTEIVDRNAFSITDMRDVCMKYNHLDAVPILARTRNHSLELNVDDKGLKVRAKLIDTQSNRDIYSMVQSGLLDKMSFAFTVSKEEWDNETDTRRILEIDKLFDVSIVDVPFYDTTEVFARSLEEFKEEYNKKQEMELKKKKLELMLSL